MFIFGCFSNNSILSALMLSLVSSVGVIDVEASPKTIYSRISMARTLMARLSRLFRTPS